MRARDVMASPVVTVTPATPIEEIARILLKRRISAVPVVEHDKIVGIVSEADLIRRPELGTPRKRSFFLLAMTGDRALAEDFLKDRGSVAEHVMTRIVVTASPSASLGEIATLMEKKRVKRVPIVENGILVGIVTRANLVRALASIRSGSAVNVSDASIRENILDAIKAEPFATTAILMNIIVTDGIVDLWGLADSAEQSEGVKLVAERTPGVRAVNNHLTVQPLTESI